MKTKIIVLAAILMTFSLGSQAANIDRSPVEYIDGELTYNLYKNYADSRYDDEYPKSNELKTNKLYGYSWAGYRGGGVALPLPGSGVSRQTVTISASELIPDDKTAAEANRLVIQAALDSVSGTSLTEVLLPRDTYYVNGPVKMNKSYTVLRGHGQAADGTTLIGVNPGMDAGDGMATFIQIGETNTWSGKGTVLEEAPLGPDLLPTNQVSKTYIDSYTRLVGYVPSGTLEVTVEDASEYAAGDDLFVVKTSNTNQLNDLHNHGLTKDWNIKVVKTSHERTVVDVDYVNNLLTLDMPLMDPIYPVFGGGFVAKIKPVPRISEVGVEDLRIESELGTSAVGPSDQTIKEKWIRSAVTFGAAENCWVSGLTCRTFCKSAVIFASARFITVQDSAIYDHNGRLQGGRRYAFNCYTSCEAILVQRTYVRGARHAFVTGKQNMGPVVFLDSFAEDNYSKTGPHQDNNVAQLYDNIHSGQSQFHWQNDRGWRAQQSTYWNSYAMDELMDSSAYMEAKELYIASPPRAANFIINTVGTKSNYKDSAYVYNEQPADDLPRSLYLAEIKHRLGQAAVDAVTTPAQREGPINDLLKVWAGQGPMMTNSLASQSQLSFYPTDDVFVKVGNSDNKENNSADEQIRTLNVSPASSGDERRAYIEFSLVGYPSNSVSEAKLHLHNMANGISSEPMSCSVYACIGNNWKEEKKDGNNLPGYTSRVYVGELSVIPNASQTYEIEVKDSIAELISSSSQDHVYFEIRCESGGSETIKFASSESRNPPRLAVVVTDEPPPETILFLVNDFDGNDANDTGGVFQIVHNAAVGAVNNSSDPSVGRIEFVDGSSGVPTVGLVATDPLDLSATSGFTLNWVVDSATTNINPSSNGMFLGLQNGVGNTTDGTSLWNQEPKSVGLRITATDGLDFVENAGSNNVSSTALLPGGTFNTASYADGFTVSLTLNDDNTWSAATTGFNVDISTNGALSSISYADIAGSVYPSAYLQSNSSETQTVNYASVRLHPLGDQPAVLQIGAEAGGTMSISGDNLVSMAAYTLQGRTNLLEGVWVDIATTTGVTQVDWSEITPTNTTMFYRVKRKP